MPQKILKDLHNKSCIQRVCETVVKCAQPQDKVIVATDSNQVEQHIASWGGPETRLTAITHQTGSDRSAEVAAQLPEYQKIIIVSADLPALTSDGLSLFAEEVRKMVSNTAIAVTVDSKGFHNHARVKVSQDLRYYRDPTTVTNSKPSDPTTIGLYAHTQQSLKLFTTTRPCAEEQAVSIEHIRFKQIHETPNMVMLDESAYSLDTQADYVKLHKLLQPKESFQ